MSELRNFDSVPYPSLTFTKTSPERLATQAAVNGMRGADPRECKYLELGCGDGTNLLAHAYMYPESQFLGIDLSQTHIDSANGAIADLGIRNTVFKQMDVMDLRAGDLGQFDYIVAHGLFSWVPESVRQRILEIYSEYLAPKGVGYISYNTYPGCHIRDMMREIIQFHTRDLNEPMKKVNSAVSILKFLGDVTDADSTYQMILREEFEGLIGRAPGNIYHDDLADFNKPFYFYEFVEMLAAIDMQYLSEADVEASNTGTLPPDAVRVLDTYSSNLIEREQYLDFIRCVRFRSTLFCRDTSVLDRNYLQDHLNEFYIAGRLRTEGPTSAVAGDEEEIFFGPTTEKIKCNHPLTKAAIRYLSEKWTWGVRFSELIERSIEMFDLPAEASSERDIARTADVVIDLFRAGLFRLRVSPDQCVSEAGQTPRVSAFARWQIERGSPNVMTLTGLKFEHRDDIARLIVILADGTRDRDEIVRAVIENLEAPKGDQNEFREIVSDRVELNLRLLGAKGLLEA